MPLIPSTEREFRDMLYLAEKRAVVITLLLERWANSQGMDKTPFNRNRLVRRTYSKSLRPLVVSTFPSSIASSSFRPV